MIRKLQSIATMRYCLAYYSNEKGSDTLESNNSLKEYWLEQGWTDSFKPSEILKGSKTISPQLVIQLDKEFPGAAQVYYYGPEGSHLWKALENTNSGRETVLILSKILGCSISQIRTLSDTHWKLLMREVPEIGFHILAYYLHLLQEHQESSNINIPLNDMTVISVGTLCIWGNISDYIDAYGLCLDDLYSAINSSKKPYSTNIERFAPKPLPKISIKPSFAGEIPLGIYLHSHLDELKDVNCSILTDENFIENEISRWELVCQ